MKLSATTKSFVLRIVQPGLAGLMTFIGETPARSQRCKPQGLK